MSVAVHTPKGKVFYREEPHRRESTTTLCGINYELLSVVQYLQSIRTALLPTSQQQGLVGQKYACFDHQTMSLFQLNHE